MSNLTTKIKGLWKRFSDREYRTVYLDEAINSRLAGQIFSLRTSRNMTQAQVSALTGIAQPTLSRLENDCRGITTATLKKIAAAYDVALVVKFATFSEFARELDEIKIDKEVPSFSSDSLVAPSPVGTVSTVSVSAAGQRKKSAFIRPGSSVKAAIAPAILASADHKGYAYVRH